jgi:hypothetical protein
VTSVDDVATAAAAAAGTPVLPAARVRGERDLPSTLPPGDRDPSIAEAEEPVAYWRPRSKIGSPFSLARISGSAGALFGRRVAVRREDADMGEDRMLKP